MLGVEVNSSELATRIAEQMMTQRIILNRTSENVLRFLPPYILERKHVDIAVNCLDNTLASLTQPDTATAGEDTHG